MAKITITAECLGCSLCVSNCPECFELDDSGKAKVIKDTCDSCDLKEVANQCPVNAIIVEE